MIAVMLESGCGYTPYFLILELELRLS
ncbi:MAG: hypothetical protein ACJAQ2_000865, partial [Vicingaceae bacterium]